MKGILDQLNNEQVTKAGWFKESGATDDGFPYVDLANIFENGGGKYDNIPAYAPVKKTTSKIDKKIESILNKRLIVFLQQGNLNVINQELGSLIGRELKKMISSIKSPANRQATIERKGYNDPMVHTGEFMRAVGYKINDGVLQGKG